MSYVPENMHSKYFEALGRFIARYANIEQTLQIVFWHHVGVPWETGRVVFSGERTNVLIDKIRRINESRPVAPEIAARYEEILPQLKAISDARNLILHYGVTPVDADVMKTTNALMAKTPGDAKEQRTDVATLEAMTHDLHKIGFHLVGIKFDQMGIPGRHEDHDKFLAAAWRYTPPKQEQKPPGRSDTQQDRTRPKRLPHPHGPSRK